MNIVPKVSIIIPVYNGSDYLCDAIKSSLLQTYKNIEIIVINDGSNDNGATRNIALSFGDQIKYFEKENGGVASALNLGIKKMNGEYFSWLSHDDIYFHNKIEKQINHLIQNNLTNAVIYSSFEIINENAEYLNTIIMPQIDPSDFRLWITENNMLHGCTLLIPYGAFKKCGLFDESLKTTQDYDLWFRMADKYDFYGISDVLVKSRIHKNQTTRKINKTVVIECNKLLHKFYLLQKDILDFNRANKLAKNYYKRGFYLSSYFVFNDLFRSKKNYAIRRKIFLLFELIKSLLRIKIKYKYLFRSLKSINNEIKFTYFYNCNGFNSKESKSGEGSTLIQTEIIREKLPDLLKNYNIKTFIDAPCGDFNWMQHVNMDFIDTYYGVDIVKILIDSNNQKYSNKKIKFIYKDIVNEIIPSGDLVFCRDCLVHLNFADCKKVINNFKQSSIKYLLTTTFTSRKINRDLKKKDIWRTLNMDLKPFSFPKPLVVINEKCSEADNKYTDKSLGLYELDKINLK